MAQRRPSQQPFSPLRRAKRLQAFLGDVTEHPSKAKISPASSAPERWCSRLAEAELSKESVFRPEKDLRGLRSLLRHPLSHPFPRTTKHVVGIMASEISPKHCMLLSTHQCHNACTICCPKVRLGKICCFSTHPPACRKEFFSSSSASP